MQCRFGLEAGVVGLLGRRQQRERVITGLAQGGEQRRYPRYLWLYI